MSSDFLITFNHENSSLESVRLNYTPTLQYLSWERKGSKNSFWLKKGQWLVSQFIAEKLPGELRKLTHHPRWEKQWAEVLGRRYSCKDDGLFMYVVRDSTGHLSISFFEVKMLERDRTGLGTTPLTYAIYLPTYTSWYVKSSGPFLSP